MNDTQSVENGLDEAENPLTDPAWRLTALLLPAGAAAAALLTVWQTLAGYLAPVVGYPAAIALALLGALLGLDARRRSASGRWVRAEAYEYALPLGLLLVALALIAHGADTVTYAPLLLVLLPVAWEMAHAPPIERVMRLLPRALPVLNGVGSESAPPARDDVVTRVVREVLDGLPPDISARLESWTIDVQEEPIQQPEGTVVFGCCFQSAHVIAIYRGPHLRYGGHGETLRRAIAYTTLHEIAHALGLDETGVRRLGWLGDVAAPA